MYHSSIKLVLALDCLVRSIKVYFFGWVGGGHNNSWHYRQLGKQYTIMG